MKLFKRSVALVMAAVMIATMAPISAEAATKKGTVKSITIKNLDSKTLVLKKGKTFKLKTKVKVTGKASKKVTYSSSNKKVATVSKSGKIKAVKKGTAKITVKSVANKKKKVTITVKVGTPITKVKLNKSKVTATVGDTVQLKATFSPKKPTVKKVTWSTNKKSVATVDKKGVVSCVGKGSVKITATAADGSGKKAVCRITVNANPNATTEAPGTTQTTETPGTTQTTEATTSDSTSNDPKPEKPTEDPIVMGDDLSYAGYTLDWADEFEGTQLNRDNWNVELHEPGWVNAELQEYVDSEENIYIEDGKLVLNPVQTKNEDGSYSYTSGRVNTQNKKTYTYGMFEVKAKVPEGAGYLPAFWLMANDESLYGQWPKCGEIDIMEVHGSDTKKTYGTIHYGDPHKESQGTYTLQSGSFSSQYHTYTCEWEPGKITWYVDGYKFHEENDWYSATEGGGTLSYPAPFDQPFYIILNLAVGGSWVGYPDNETFEANPYMIDYVKVYQKDGGYDDSNVTAPEKEEVVIRDADENGNYLINGDFSEAEDLVLEEGWQFKTASEGVGNTVISTGDVTTPAIDGNSAIVTTTNDGTVDYSIQLLQNNVPLIAGQTYVLSFDAYASADRNMKVNSKAPNRGWHAYLDETVELTTEKQTFTCEFEMIHADDANCTVEFNMGNFDSTDTVVIDNVSLKIKDGAIDETARDEVNNPPKSARADGNYIYNGQFQEGDKHLGDWEIPEGVDVSVTPLSDGRRLKVVVTDDAPVVISQKSVPVTAEGQFALSMDAKLPEGGNVTVGFLGENYQVVPENGTYDAKFTTPATMDDKTFTITFSGEGTYYIDNVRVEEDAMIKNGSFSAGSSGFTLWVDSNAGANASLGIDSITEGNDNTAMVTVKHSGPYDHNIQLKQTGVSLEQGKWYQISLKARVLDMPSRTVKLALQRDGSDDGQWTEYLAETLELTNDYQTYTFDFPMSAASDDATIFSVSMGPTGIWGEAVADPTKVITTQHRVCIDDIELIEIESQEISTIPVGENQIRNATFEDDSEWIVNVYDGGKATHSLVDNAMEIDVTNVGAADGEIALQQKGLTLEKGEKYTLSFDVTSTVDRDIKPCFMIDGTWGWYGGKIFNLSAEEMNHIVWTFEINDTISGDIVDITNKIVLGIHLGNLKTEGTAVAGKLTFDNFSLVKLSKDGGEEPGEEPEDITSIEPGVNQLVLSSMIDGSWGGAKEVAFNEDAIVYAITDVGTDKSHIQLKQTGITLEQGESYTVSFKVDTTAARDIIISLLDEADGYKWYGGEQKALAEGEQVVEFTFTVNEADNDGITFQIAMGQMFDGNEEIDTPASTITLSEFSLVKNAKE